MQTQAPAGMFACVSAPMYITKRSGACVDFDAERIERSLYRAGAATKEFDGKIARLLAQRVVLEIGQWYADSVPGIESTQDLVEKTLFDYGYFKTARAYIVYRE